MLGKLATAAVSLLVLLAGGCEDHDWTSPLLGGYVNHALMSRHDRTRTIEKRIQPGALPTLPQQIKDIHWGQVNFLSTTDTHGWLAGHLLDENYSAGKAANRGFPHAVWMILADMDTFPFQTMAISQILSRR